MVGWFVDCCVWAETGSVDNQYWSVRYQNPATVCRWLLRSRTDEGIPRPLGGIPPTEPLLRIDGRRRTRCTVRAG